MTTKKVTKAAASKTEYYYADSEWLSDLSGPFDTVALAQQDAYEEGYTKFHVFTLQGQYEVNTITTYKEVK